MQWHLRTLRGVLHWQEEVDELYELVMEDLESDERYCI